MKTILVQPYNYEVKITSAKSAFSRIVGTKLDYTNVRGYAVHLQDYVLIYLPKDCDLSTIVHESTHASWYILSTMGVHLNADNHEAQSYLIEYLFEEIRKIYGK